MLEYYVFQSEYYLAFLPTRTGLPFPHIVSSIWNYCFKTIQRQWHPVLICSSRFMNHTQVTFTCLSAIYILSLVNFYLDLLFINWLVLILTVTVLRVLYFGYKSFIRYVFFKYILPVWGLFFHFLNIVFHRVEDFNFNKIHPNNFFFNKKKKKTNPLEIIKVWFSHPSQ